MLENPNELDQIKLYEKKPDNIPPSPLWRFISPSDEQCIYLSQKIGAWENARGVGIEVLSVTPPVIVFHNFLSDVEAQEARNSADRTGRLARSTVNDPGSGQLIHAEYRTSEGAFIWDRWLYPNIVEIERRISLITGLSLEKADDLQIAHYAPGGHYEPHVDMAHQPKVIRENVGGNRIATWLMYLNDVSIGGATAFIEADPPFVIRPRRGSVLFWYNLGGPHGVLPNLSVDENGKTSPYDEILQKNKEQFQQKNWYRKPTEHGDNGIFETRHAACPVHSGVKWVANKWIREYPTNSHRYHNYYG